MKQLTTRTLHARLSNVCKKHHYNYVNVADDCYIVYGNTDIVVEFTIYYSQRSEDYQLLFIDVVHVGIFRLNCACEFCNDLVKALNGKEWHQ